MNVYAESSAIVAWLLAESDGARVVNLLAHANAVVTSDLTLIESARVLVRAVAQAKMPEAEAGDRLRDLDEQVRDWDVLPITGDIVERAKKPFPFEPIRSLDAIHLASALTARMALPDLEIISLDDRIRNAARQLGFRVQPE